VRLRSIGLFAVLVLVIASCGSGSPEAGDSSDGIQVHGDWTIDIYNKDGSLDQHVEFSNALKDQGAHDLISALAGLRTFSGDWQILLEGLVNDPCPSDLFPGCLFSGNPVGVEDVDGDSLRDILHLGGVVTVEDDSEFDTVKTYTATCSNDTAPIDCSSSGTWLFTGKTLNPAIAVEAGQLVQVEVEISFTSG
jgi:hypothetical protein